MVRILKKLFKKEKITQKYKNGDTYVGEMKNDKNHGHGTETYADGSKYVGEWKDGKRCGQGTNTWTSGDFAGDKYIGEWKNDERKGQGTYMYADGAKYVGEWKDDDKHGYGTGIDEDTKYVGEWKDNKYHGQGTFTSNEIKFVGKFKDGERTQGTQTWISGEFAGNKYIGNYKDNEIHGQGTHTWADGDKYVGAWKNGTRCGQGIFTWENKDEYVGEFKDDKMCGQGTMAFADGDKYVGTWEDDEQCEGAFTSADGKVEKITKTIKRNELTVFEEYRLKPEDVKNEPPKKKDLLEIDDVYFYYNTKLKKNTYWVLTTPEYSQVDEYRATIDPDHEDYQLNRPKKSSLKKYKTDVKVHIEEYDEEEDTSYLTWWKEDKNGDLVQVNLTEKEDAGVEFKVKSWLRNKAIDAVGLEIRNMKKKAYEYSEDELMGMIKKEENKMIKKGGWKALRIAALSTLGLPFLGFL